MDNEMILHECGEASDMFYCYGIADSGGFIDWYVREDSTVVNPNGKRDTVGCIEYCPFCGLKLPDEKSELDDTYRIIESD